MIFSWLKERRRKKILSDPFPARWRSTIRKNASFYDFLTDSERAKLEQDIRLLVAEKSWEGARGVKLSGIIQAIIAAQASLLVLNRSVDDFQRLHTILVYPRAYRAQRKRMEGGIVVEGDGGLLGESWPAGTVVLSLEDALEGGRHGSDGRNLVLHEFAHQLDMADHVVDGTPVLDDRQAYSRWVEVMTTEFKALRKGLQHGVSGILGEYAATNEAEFFAVATEVFFEKPSELLARHPALYGVLRDYYRQDPAARAGGG